VKSIYLTIRVTEDRRELWKQAAARAKEFEGAEDLDFSAWIRRALNTAMKNEAKRYPAGEKRGKGGGR